MFRKVRQLFESLELNEETPNKFTIFYGMKLKEARKEKGISQTQLAEAIYKRRPSLSELENGKMMPDLATALLAANYLDKPLSYFIHPSAQLKEPEDLHEEELQLLAIYRQLSALQKKIAIQQMQVLGNGRNNE